MDHLPQWYHPPPTADLLGRLGTMTYPAARVLLMSDVYDRWVHRLLLALDKAQSARRVCETAQKDVDDLHPLDNQFLASDMAGRLKASLLAYSNAQDEFEKAFDDSIPDVKL